MLEFVGAPAPEAPTAVDMDVAGVLDAIDCVLACASDDEPAVRGLLDDIAGLGLAPKLISGVEAGVDALRDAIFEQFEGGLVVLCVSESIGRTQARRLAEVFNLHHGAAQQLLVAAVDRRAPSALLSPIRRATNDYRQRRGAAPISTPGLKGSGDSCSVSGSALSFDDAPVSDDALQDVASVVLDCRLRDEVGVIPETIVFSAVRRSRKRKPSRGEDTERPTLELLPVLTPVDEDADTDPEEPSESPAVQAKREGNDSAAQRAGARRWVALSGGGLAVAAAVVALSAGRTSSSATTQAEPTSISAPELSLHKSHPVSTEAAEAPKPRMAQPAEAPSTNAGAAEPQSVDAPLEAAAAEGRIHILPGFFATKPYLATSTWRAAANRCRSRSVDGIRGWRLPKPAELRALWRSKRARDAVYWSGSKAVRAPKPSNWALDGGAGVLTTREKADLAATICVRSRLSKGRSATGSNSDPER